MEVYIECVIIDNFVINSVLLNLTSKINKLILKWWQITLISLFGTLIAILSPFLSGVWLFITKLILSILMPIFLAIYSKQQSYKKLFVITITFCLLNYLLIGACLVICNLFQIKYSVINGQIEIFNFPIGLAVAVTMITYYLLKNLIVHFYNIKKLNKFQYIVNLQCDKNIQVCNAFLDSGNKLTDNEKPIILINYKLFNKLHPNIKLSDILLKRYNKFNLKNVHEIEIKGLAKSSKIMIFEIDNIEIKDINLKFENVLCGLSLKDFETNLNADCILNPMLFD